MRGSRSFTSRLGSEAGASEGHGKGGIADGEAPGVKIAFGEGERDTGGA